VSTETFVVCDRCGAAAKWTKENPLNDWRRVSIESNRPQTPSIFSLGSSELHAAHVCAKCGAELVAWLNLKQEQEAS
jgi:hypothetical protein